MSGRGVRLAIGVLGTIVAIVAEVLAFQEGQTPSAGLLHLAIGLTYLYGGLAIWGHEPTNRTGALMAAVGLTWFIGPFAHAGIPVVSEVGLALEDTTTVLLLALVLAYPSGRLTSRVDRAAVAILAVGATGLNLLFSTSLFTDRSGPDRAVRRPGARDDDDGRDRPALADRTRALAAGAPAGPRRRARLPGDPDHQPHPTHRRRP